MRDNEWENTLIKFGYSRERSNVQIECIQTAYKFEGKYWDTIIIDEVHTALSPIYRNLLLNNTYKRLLCLTATVDDTEKLNFITSLAPIVWETNRERAISLKLVSESIIFNYGVTLSKDEESAYKRINDAYLKAEEELGGARVAFGVSGKFLRLSKMNKDGSNMLVYKPENRVIYANEADDISIPKSLCRQLTENEVNILKGKIYNSRQYWKYMRDRKELLVNTHSKLNMVKYLCNRYSDRKGIIFSASVEMANLVQELLGESCGKYHYKMSPKSKAQTLLDFADNKLLYLSTIKALNAGLDVPECSLGITTACDSKKLAAVQRNGRISRYVDGKVSYYFNLYVINTQDEVWVRRATTGMEPKWVNDIGQLPLE